MKSINLVIAICLFIFICNPINLLAQKEEETTVKNPRKREGPDNTPFEFLQQIKSEYDLGSSTNILNINRQIFPDKNPKSGAYYYLPNHYDLQWSNEDCGYAFNIDYLPMGADGKQVAIVTAKLHPNFSQQDLEVARELLAIDVKQKEKDNPAKERYGVKNLYSMPLGAPPTVDFTQVTSELNESVTVQGLSDFLEPIVISWRMENVEMILAALFNNFGLKGAIVFQPEGDMPKFRIPLTIKIDDPKTFGRFELQHTNWRTAGWENPTDFPIALKNLHVLRMEKKAGLSLPKIYTWKMGDVEIPENAKAVFKHNLVPTWIDSDPKVKRIWMEYAVRSCGRCKETVLECIRSGGHKTPIKKIEFTVMNALQFTKAEMLRIKVRSYQVSPSKQKGELPTINITNDGSTTPGGTLFVPEGSPLSFEYKIAVYMPDGSRYESANWVNSNEGEVVIGSRQIKEQIAHFNKTIK